MIELIYLPELHYDFILSDSVEPITPLSAYEHPLMGSLEISIDERKFLDDEHAIQPQPTVLDVCHLRTRANHTSFPDIDHDGSIDTFSHHEEPDGILCNHTLDSNDNQQTRQNSRQKNKNYKHLASLDDI